MAAKKMKSLFQLRMMLQGRKVSCLLPVVFPHWNSTRGVLYPHSYCSMCSTLYKRNRKNGDITAPSTVLTLENGWGREGGPLSSQQYFPPSQALMCHLHPPTSSQVQPANFTHNLTCSIWSWLVKGQKWSALHDTSDIKRKARMPDKNLSIPYLMPTENCKGVLFTLHKAF